MFRRLGAFALVCALGLLALAIDARQTTGNKRNAKNSVVAAGAALYKRNCAVCHGNDAKGGPAPDSRLFTQPAPDLTTLAKRHEGKFPDEYVAAILRSGVKKPAHGPAEMPVWGMIFQSAAKSDEAQADKRIADLTAYLKSLQVK